MLPDAFTTGSPHRPRRVDPVLHPSIGRPAASADPDACATGRRPSGTSRAPMNFATFGYVVFLLLVVGGYWLLPRRARHWWLLGASLFFYGSWNLVYVPGFLLLIGFNFLMGRLVARPG